VAQDVRPDVFVSHAGEDKQAVVRPLSAALKDLGWDVWFDEERLVVGDSLESSIAQALAQSDFGVVVLSKSFFSKAWPKRELEGLATRETNEDRNVILPVWHEITRAEVAAVSPILAGKLAANTRDGIETVAKQLDQALRRAGRAPRTAKPSLRSLAYDVTTLVGEALPNWQAAEQLLDELDGIDLAKRASEGWASVDIWNDFPSGGPSYIRIPDAVLILRADLEALMEAIDSPPEWLSTSTLDNGQLVHAFDEREMPQDFQHRLSRLRDAQMLQAAGLLPGGW
jgi:hypothetical protein